MECYALLSKELCLMNLTVVNINELYLCDMIIIGVNLWMEELDKHYKQKLQQQNTCTPAMTRIIGSVSQFSSTWFA